MSDNFNSREFVAGIRRDFRLFCHALWHYHGLHEKAPLSDFEYDICHWLQHGPKRRGVLAFRGMGKSYITDAYAAWTLFCDPQKFVLLVSASQTIARQNLHLIRGWIKSTPFLEHLAPRPGTKERDGIDAFDVAGNAEKMPSLSAAGVTAQLPSRRSHLIVPDDVEIAEECRTREARTLLRERIREFDAILLPKGDIVYLGTPQHEQSVYPEMVAKGYTFRSWPARYPSPDQQIINLAPMLQRKIESGEATPGEPTCGHRFPEEELLAREAAWGRSGFAMQYMLQMGLADSLLYPLKLADLILFPVHPEKAPATIAWGKHTNTGSTAAQEIPSVGLNDDGFYRPIMVDPAWLPYQGTKMFVDPSGGAKDETAWAIVGQLHGYLYVKRVGAYTGGHTTENLERIAADAFAYRVNDLYLERRRHARAALAAGSEALLPRARGRGPAGRLGLRRRDGAQPRPEGSADHRDAGAGDEPAPTRGR